MSESPELIKLKSFLNILFQFENQDLDFGIYKILNYKRKAISEFIDTLLVDEVKSQLNILEESEREKLKNQLDELEKDEVIKGYAEAKDENTKNVLLNLSKEKIDAYLSLKEQFESHQSTSNAEPVIYNHLTEFFKRYYDKGDFISKRRYSKNEKYVVPYNGEETYFYWANQDQYYIKSSEFFTKYSFKINVTDSQICIVNFKLTEAQEESGNVKSETNKYFILSDKQIEYSASPVIPANAGIQSSSEINIFFEYRAISEDEKKSFGKNQDELNSNATDEILKSLKKNPAYVELTKIIKSDKSGKDEKSKKNEKNKLKYELDKYTNRNKYDFFIHKDLKSFLSRELDFYIKNEMLYLNDLSLFDSETHLEKIRLHLNIIKTFKHIADTIIDFVSQIENFQKKLWEKKKFVISTHYVITLDKLAEWTSKEFMNDIIPEVLKNKNQIEEWKELFGEDLFKDWKKIKPEDLKADMYSYKKLPIDTKHFPDEFKWKLLIELSKKLNIEDELNGLLLHSDNFHGLNLLQEKFYESVKCVYIDPPYNTGNDGFLYKDNFKDSTWLTALTGVIGYSKDVLNLEGINFISIDDIEDYRLEILLNTTFGQQNFVSKFIWKKRSGGGYSNTLISTNHEYVLSFAKSERVLLIDKEKEEEWINNYYNCEDEISKYKRRDMRKSGTGDRRIDRPTMYYEVIAPDGSSIFPKKPNDEDGRWSIGQTTFRKMLKSEYEIVKVNGEWKVYLKERNIDNEGTQKTEKYESILVDVPLNSEGTKEIEKLFGDKNVFLFPKPTGLIQRLIKLGCNENGTVLDYFSGSGTTAHAIMKQNKDNGNRKFILVEHSDYFTTIMIPRIKKVAFSFDWNEGKPKNMCGLGIFFKYQKLEQYEDSLENIAFTKTIDDKQLRIYKDYIPKYFLEFETSGSRTFLNTEEMQNPFDYKLKVFDNYDYVEKAVDLIETFNYLIGLYVHKYKIKDDQGKDYYFVYGKDRAGKKVLVIWRDVNNIDFKKDKVFIEKELKNFIYDKLYINSQSAVEGYEQIENVFKNKMN